MRDPRIYFKNFLKMQYLINTLYEQSVCVAREGKYSNLKEGEREYLAREGGGYGKWEMGEESSVCMNYPFPLLNNTYTTYT